MHWVIQENIFKEKAWDDLIDILIKLKIPYSIHKVVPFVGELLPDINPTDKKVICFGSYSMRHVADKKGWNPGVYDVKPFDFIKQFDNWGKHMLNSDSTIIPFENVVFDGVKFVRPIDDSKYFTGQVFDGKEFEEWRYKVCDLKEDYGNSLTNSTLVQVCSPKTIYQEARFWIVDGKIVTQSLYKRGNTVLYTKQVDDDMVTFANAMVAIWQPLKAFVLDICETSTGYKIVEINTINSSGFYSAEIDKLVNALEEVEK